MKTITAAMATNIATNWEGNKFKSLASLIMQTILYKSVCGEREAKFSAPKKTGNCIEGYTKNEFENFLTFFAGLEYNVTITLEGSTHFFFTISW